MRASIAVTHENRRAALALRYLHALVSIGLVAASALGVLLAHGPARRTAWDAAADLLLANGLVGLLLVPVLLVSTAYLRRGWRLAARGLTLDGERLRVLLADGEVLDVAHHEVSSVELARTPGLSPAKGSRVRVTIVAGEGAVRDRLHLDLAPERAEALLARLPSRPRTVDVGVRSLEAAAWSLTLSYAAGCAAALLLTPRLRAIVPVEPGELLRATDHAGWLLGVGLAGFWIAHAALAWWMAPSSRLLIGCDGVQVRSRDGARWFVPFLELSDVERRRRTLRLHRTGGRPVDVDLGAVGPRARDRAAQAILEARDAAADVRGDWPRSEDAVRAQAARLGAEGYRIEPVTDDRLVAQLAAPRATAGARVGAALVLAGRGAEGCRIVHRSAQAVADDDTRAVLEAIAAGDIEHGTIDRLLARAPGARR